MYKVRARAWPVKQERLEADLEGAGSLNGWAVRACLHVMGRYGCEEGVANAVACSGGEPVEFESQRPLRYRYCTGD